MEVALDLESQKLLITLSDLLFKIVLLRGSRRVLFKTRWSSRHASLATWKGYAYWKSMPQFKICKNSSMIKPLKLRVKQFTSRGIGWANPLVGTNNSLHSGPRGFPPWPATSSAPRFGMLVLCSSQELFNGTSPGFRMATETIKYS